MKTKPILFSTEMVKAILEGRKTQTRRTNGLDEINVNPDDWQFEWTDFSSEFPWRFTQKSTINEKSLKERNFYQAEVKSKYQKGDILWVRETFKWEGETKYTDISPIGSFWYKADFEDGDGPTKWKPSIFMPKEACRIFLEVTDIKVERLQDISEEDACDEGITLPNYAEQAITDIKLPEPSWIFEELWNSINGPESWNLNPHIFAYTFKKVNEPENF